MMNMFTSALDMTLRAKCGQSFEFKAGVPIYVSPQAQAEAITAGCVPNAPRTAALTAAANLAAADTAAAVADVAAVDAAAAVAADAVVAEIAAAAVDAAP